MSRKKSTISSYIMRVAKENPNGFSAATVREILPADRHNRLSTGLWLLKKRGVLSHNEAEGTYKLTAVNKSEATKAQKPEVKRTYVRKAPTQQALVDMTREHQRQITAYDVQITRLREELRRADEKHNDALAIIRYLEDKLFKAIQFDARQNGRNA